jgi:hypothetical protein
MMCNVEEKACKQKRTRMALRQSGIFVVWIVSNYSSYCILMSEECRTWVSQVCVFKWVNGQTASPRTIETTIHHIDAFTQRH